MYFNVEKVFYGDLGWWANRLLPGLCRFKEAVTLNIMKNIILVGHSHINCIFLELAHSCTSEYLVRQVHLNNLAVEMKQKGLADTIKLNDYAMTRLDEITDGFSKGKNWLPLKKTKLNIVLLFGGRFHSIIGLLKMNPPFDFIHPDFTDLDLDEDATIVPFNALKKMCKLDIDGHEGLLKRIKDSYSCNIFHLGFPPPLEDDEMVMSNLESYFTDNYENPKLAHKNVRFKLWCLYSDMFNELCNKYNIPFLPVPETMVNDKMYLKKEAYGDTIHANRLYAKHYIDSFSSRLV